MAEISNSFEFKRVTKTGSFGEGVKFGLYTGYMFNDHIGVELQGDYLLGREHEVSASLDANPSTFISYDKSSVNTKINTFLVGSSVVLRSGFESIDPYAKLGIMLGFINYTEVNTLTSTITDNQLGFSREIESDGMSFGFQSAFGVAYHISENLSVFTEVNMINMTYKPDEATLVSVRFNGEEQIDQLSDEEKTIKYEDEVVLNGLVISSNELPSVTYPLSHTGLRAGIQFNF